MKAGNISPAAELTQAVSGVRMQGNVDSSAETKTGSFQMYLAANTGRSRETDFLPAASEKDVRKIPDEGGKDFSKLQENTVKDKITDDAKKTKGKEPADKEQAAAAAAAETQIRDAVKEELGLTDEELEAALAELGLCVADLLIPQNAALLVAKVNDTDVTSIVADEGLTKQLAGLMTAVNAAAAGVAEQFGIEPEQLPQLLEQAKKQPVSEDGDGREELPVDAKEPEEQPEFVVVKDENTGKEIKVTVEDGRETDSDVSVQYARTPENAKASADDQPDRRQHGSGQRNQNAFADHLVQNLTQAVAERTDGIPSFTESYTVNAADVIRQLVEAIRVNVNSATTSMELQLNPENLGKINLNVATRNGVLTATITAQNEAVKGIIESQIVQLKESLDNQGLKVQSVEVAVANHGFNLGENNAGQEQNNGHGTHRRRHSGNFDELSEDDGETPDILEQRIMEADGSSVNYTA